MPSLTDDIRFRCNPHLRRQLEAIATKRRCSLSEAVRMCLQAYFATEKDQQLAATLETFIESLGQVQDNTEHLTSMLDRAVLTLLIHLPEITAEEQAQALHSGNRRYAQWRSAVRDHLVSRFDLSFGPADKKE